MKTSISKLVLARFGVISPGPRLHSTTMALPVRALQNGDSLPPANPDVLRLYSMRFCAYAHRTRIVLEYKQIPHETINCNLRNKADWLFARNPFGLVPVIEYKNKLIYESSICNEFLDDLFPAKKLVPSDPYQKAKDKELMHYFDTKGMAFAYLVLRPERDGADKARDNLKLTLDKLEGALGEHSLFGGDQPCMVDFHIYPWFERFAGFRKISKDGYDPLPLDRYPGLSGWLSRMQQRPEIKNLMMDLELQRQFIMSLFNKSPNYDLGLQAASSNL